MRALKFAPALGAAALMICVLTTSSDAQQQRARQRAPIIQVSSLSGGDVINTSTYVEPQIRLSENAYVFAVEMDLDGQIQVLHPDFPGLSVKISAHTQLRLPNFFAGFNQAYPDRVYSTVSYQRYGNYSGFSDTRGTVLALASRVPFNLERIQSGDDWNMSAIRRLIEYRNPQEALSQLANYIGAKDEPIGRDYMRFAGGGNNRAYAYANEGFFSPCDYYYGYFYSPGLGFAQRQALNRINRARGGGQARIIGYDLCGVPIVTYGQQVVTKFPVPGHPRNGGDTTVFPKSRFHPDPAMPRHPRETPAQGAFPLPSRAGTGQMGDVTITAPTGRRSDPRQIIEGYRPQPGAIGVPQGRMPIDRSVPVAAPSAGSGGPPLREYNPEPRVQSPPPARVPDRTPAPAPAPTPVVHERPSTPAPPPPRAENPSKPPPSKQ